MATKQEKMEAFGQLLDILDELRVKCPWDRKQTNESLRTNTIEETYELCDAIMKDDNNNIKKELGDLLLHIVFYAKIGEEKAAFDIKDVCDSLRIQDKARNVGFDWEQRDQVWDKVHEEFTELKTEIDKMDADKMEAEFGDLFFSLINEYKVTLESKAMIVGIFVLLQIVFIQKMPMSKLSIIAI